MAGVVKKFAIASLFMWIVPIAILYGFNHNLFPGFQQKDPYFVTLISGFLAVISVNVVIALYICLAMREPSDKHVPDPKFLAEAKASVSKLTDPSAVGSPRIRRILSLKNKSKSTVSIFDSDEKPSRLGVSGDHGPKTSEVYGFVGSISTVVATVLFFIWAYVPESWLSSAGIYNYPNRYWALAAPAFATVTVISALGLYIALNFIATPPPTSFYTIYDEYSREPTNFMLIKEGEEQPIEPISDIGIDKINNLMFNKVR